jgi:hypothetical protein
MVKTTVSNYKAIDKPLQYFLSSGKISLISIKNPNRGVLPSLVHEA